MYVRPGTKEKKKHICLSLLYCLGFIVLFPVGMKPLPQGGTELWLKPPEHTTVHRSNYINITIIKYSGTETTVDFFTPSK